MPSAREGNKTKDESGKGRAAGAWWGPGSNWGSSLGGRLLNPSLTKLPSPSPKLIRGPRMSREEERT